MVASLSTSKSGGATTAVIQHEYVHFLLDNHARFVYPAWYHEGFAQFLGATRFRANDVEIGGITSHGPPYLTFRGRDVWTHVRDILGYAVGGHDGERVWQRYPESWALVHYLYFGRKGMGSGPRQVARYLRLVAEGEPISDAVKSAIGVDVDTLDEELRAYVKKGHYPGATIDRSKFSAPVEPTVTRVPRADIARELAFLAYRQGNYREARHYFDRVLIAKPGDARALAGQALILTNEENSEEAEAKIRLAIANAPDDATVRRFAGSIPRWQALQEENDESKIAEFARSARKHYVKAWKLDDSVPATFAAYGSTYLLKGQDASKGLKTLEHAHAMLPASVPILNWLAQVHMKTGDSDEARRLALIAYSSPAYGTNLGDKELENLEELLRETGGLPRETDEDD
jgi:Flp pilus assembly protein TadD